MRKRSRKCWKNDSGLAARPSASAIASAAATGSTPTAAAFAGNHGTSFVHYQRATHQVAAIAGFDGAVGGGVVVDFDEAESASLAGESITHHVYAINRNTR